MAESLKFEKSIDKGSENIPDTFCEPCYELKNKLKPVEGYCIDCGESLCLECFNYHLGPKPFRNHKLVDKSAKSQTQPKPSTRSPKAGEICSVHGTTIQSFCTSHSQLCCKVCHAMNHNTCDVQEISNLAQNIGGSQELETLNKKLRTIEKGFEENLLKTGHHELTIQKNFTNAINAMKKLRDEIDKLLNETEKLAEKVQEDDIKKIKRVSSNCNIVITQITNIKSNLDTLKDKKEDERLFISMKQAEGQLKSLEEGLQTLENDNTVREYTFELDKKLKVMMKDLKVFGQLTFTKQVQAQQKSHAVTIQEQMAKTALHVTDINAKSASEQNFNMYGSTLVSNSQFLITDNNNKKIKQFNSLQGTLISELQLAGNPFDITKVKTDEVAVTVLNPNQIQLVSVTQHSLQKGKAIPVKGTCKGIAYNDIDQTFLVTYDSPAKVEIINMTGTVLKILDKDSTGAQLFIHPNHVALSPDKKGMYISDYSKHSVTLLTLSGDIKTVYKDSKVYSPTGIYVHKSGLVYVVGCNSQTVHMIEPGSGKFKLLLEKKDGLENPWSISYCELEDKLYVGLVSKHTVKVFKMK